MCVHEASRGGKSKAKAALLESVAFFAYSDALYEDFENPEASLGAGDIAIAVQAEAAAGNDAFSARLLTRLFGRPDAEFRDDLTFLLIGLNAP